VDGKLTAWCAQHDEIDFSPRPARTYELVSLSGDESVGIVRLLMSLDQPSPEVVQAIDAAVAWFNARKKSRAYGLSGGPTLKRRGALTKSWFEDPLAPAIWARFYEIGTNRPIFSDRDGIAKHDLAEIGYERPQRLRLARLLAGRTPEKGIPGVEDEVESGCEARHAN